MGKILEIAARNLMRYRRRTLLTSLLVVIGIAAVLLFVAITGSFKALMIGQITDSMLGHLQVHRRGYVASIESLPLNLNMAPKLAMQAAQALEGRPAVVPAGQGVTERAAEPVQDRGLQQEELLRSGASVQHLLDEVVDDEPVVAREPGDEPGHVVAPPHRERRQLQRRDPAFGAVLEQVDLRRGQADPGRREVGGRLVGRDLDAPEIRAEPGRGEAVVAGELGVDEVEVRLGERPEVAVAAQELRDDAGKPGPSVAAAADHHAVGSGPA